MVSILNRRFVLTSVIAACVVSGMLSQSLRADTFLFGFSGLEPQALEIDLSGGGTLVFTTGESQFTTDVQNQGWWSATVDNSDGNDNYATGQSGSDLFNNFFTFNLEALAGSTAIGARLILDSAKGSAAADEGPLVDVTYSLFDVSTDAATLNFNSGSSAAISSDLGTGTNYGDFVVSTGVDGTTLTFELNAAAISDINAASGSFFSIGGTLFPGNLNSVPEPSTLVLLGTLAPLGLVALRRRKRLA